jgi:hypothetical protein
MQQIASDPTKFYSYDKGCVSPAHSSATNFAILQSIANDFATTRLLPFNTS